MPSSLEFDLPPRPNTAGGLPTAREFRLTSLTVPNSPYASVTPSARTSYTRVDMDAVDTAELEETNEEGEEQQAPQSPIVSISFLLVSGLKRIMTFDPDTTVGRVKDLLWNSWPGDEDWQADRPPAPSYLRILHLGKILQDEDTLKALDFPVFLPTTPSLPTIVHLSIRPYGPEAEEDLKDGMHGKGACCGCIVS